MNLQLLIGPIASGKSTYSFNAAHAGYLCINDDAIVNMLHANNYRGYRVDLKILYKSIENHIISTGLSMGKNVIVDRGLNISVEGRKRFIALAKSFDICCEAIVFQKESPDVHARRRFDNGGDACRGHSYEYWLKVAEKHESIYVAPSKEEGFDDIYEISYEEIVNGKVIEGRK